MRIKVVTDDNHYLEFDMNIEDNVATLISLLKRMDGIIPVDSEFVLHFAGRRMESVKTLEFYWVQENSIISLTFLNKNSSDAIVSHSCSCF